MYLQLKHTFGINGNVGLVLVSSVSIVHSVGAVLVVTDKKTLKQTHILRGHTSQVTCLAAEGGGDWRIVSGQRDPKGVGKPFALVWQADKTQAIAKLEGPEKSINAVAIGSNETILVGGGDEHNTLFVYRNFQLIHAIGTGKSVISYFAWGERNCAMATKDNIKVFDVETDTLGKSLVFRSAATLYHELHGLILELGTGQVVAFQQKAQLVQFPKTQAFCWEVFGKKVVGISEDKHLYTATLDEHGNWIIHKGVYLKFPIDKIACLAGPYFATRDHKLARIAEDGQAETLHISAFKEAWGLAIHPTKALAVTGDFSGRLQFFDLANLRPLADRQVNCGKRVFSLAFSPDGKFLAVGQDEGWLTILNFATCKEVFQRKVGAERITELKYTPDAQNLIVGCWDQLLYVVRKDFHIAGALRGHSSSPVSLHLSKDGKFVISDSKDAQTLCWRISDGERITKGIRELEVEVNGWTGVLDPQVKSIWEDERYGDRSDINTVAQRGDCLVVGDDLGSVKLFPFPCPQTVPCLDEQHNVHYAGVTRVVFGPTGLLLSLGGIDHALCVWNVGERAEADPSRTFPRVTRSWDEN